MAPECFFGEFVLFKRKVARVRRVGVLLLMPFSPLHFTVPWKQTKEKNGKACSAGKDFNENICFVHLGDQVELSR